MLTYPKSTMRVRRMPMHLSSGHVTLVLEILPPPLISHQSDLGRRADSRWALPQISSCIWTDLINFICVRKHPIGLSGIVQMNLAAGTDHYDQKRTCPPVNGGTSDNKCFVWLKQYNIVFLVYMINY